MIIYEGDSLINGDPIVVIAIPDTNPKIGEMLCTYILRQDRPPEIAAFDGSDESICGGCKYRAQPKLDAGNMRPASTRLCYVRLSSASDAYGTPKADETMGPAEVWRAWKDGKFGVWTRPWFDKVERRVVWYQYHGPLSVRLGSYGDPGAVPTAVWADLVRYAHNWTGYTHMWRQETCAWCDGTGESADDVYKPSGCPDCDGTGKINSCDQGLKKYCMASTDTLEERAEANSLGWRAFVVVPEDIEYQKRFKSVVEMTEHTINEDVLCPMTAGKPVTCNTCHMCQGTSSKVKLNIYEKIHGVNSANHVWDA